MKGEGSLKKLKHKQLKSSGKPKGCAKKPTNQHTPRGSNTHSAATTH